MAVIKFIVYTVFLVYFFRLLVKTAATAPVRATIAGCMVWFTLIAMLAMVAPAVCLVFMIGSLTLAAVVVLVAVLDSFFCVLKKGFRAVFSRRQLA